MRKVLPNGVKVPVVLTLVLIATGCSTAWISTLDSILAAAAPALINILQIVAVAQGVPVNTALEAKINADASTVKVLAADFAKASSSSSQGVCQQLQAAIVVYEGDQQLVLQAAQVSDPRMMAKVTALVDLVAGTVSAITAAIPSCQTTVVANNRKSAASLRVIDFVENYNGILLGRTGNTNVDAATSKMALHAHSKTVRFATLGILH